MRSSGLSPGRTGNVHARQLERAGPPTAGGSGAIGERFADGRPARSVAVTQGSIARTLTATISVVIWTDTPVISDAFAFETTVEERNPRASGIDIFDLAARLRQRGSPAQPCRDGLARQVPGRSDAASSWARTTRSACWARSPAIAGWHFSSSATAMVSDRTLLLGRDLRALELLPRLGRVGDGGQRHRGSRRRILPDRSGPCSGTACSISTRWGSCRRPPCRRFSTSRARRTSSRTRDRESAPRVGVTFNGTRRDVLVQDIVAIQGPRVPSAAESPRASPPGLRLRRVAGRPADAGQIAKLDSIRRAWEAFFLQATERRMRADTPRFADSEFRLGSKRCHAAAFPGCLSSRSFSFLCAPALSSCPCSRVCRAYNSLHETTRGRILVTFAAFMAPPIPPTLGAEGGRRRKSSTGSSRWCSEAILRKSCRAPWCSSGAAIGSCIRRRSATGRCAGAPSR